MILTLRTDKPDSEIGLYENNLQQAYYSWPAHRQLAETIHQKVADLLHEQQKQLSDISAIVVYKGPGSFTGLRIGLSVANALAASYTIPVIAVNGDNWINDGLQMLASGDTSAVALPEYGSAPHITVRKK